MRSTNPVMTTLEKDQRQHQGYQPYGQQSYGMPAQQAPQRAMTVDDVVTKTGITLAVIIVMAIVNFGISMVNPGLALILTGIGGIGGFITVLISAFSRKFGSAMVTLIYAAFEGLSVGGLTLLFSGWMIGQENAGLMIGQAVLGTVGVFIGMLFVYKTGAIKVTPKFTKILIGALVGVAVLSLGNLLLALFTGFNPLRDGGMLAIVFSLVCIGLAALSFLQDFDAADKLIRAGAPAENAWGVALGLAVTLVWLYTEILRLLSYFQQR